MASMNKKRVVALDFDDVILDTMVPFLEHYAKTYGMTVEPEHGYAHESPAWGVPYSGIIERAIHYHATEQVQNIAFVDGAKQAIAQLAKTCELHIITGRPDPIIDVTREIIEQYFPGVFASVNFTGAFATTKTMKSTVCHELGVDFFVDDHIKHAVDVASSGIRTLLFGNYAWNQTDTLPETIRRVHDWDEALKIIGNSK